MKQEQVGYRRVIRSLGALQKLRDLEAEIREQASGSQDGYLLDVANRMRAELKKFTWERKMWLPDTPQDHDNRMYEAGRADAADRIKELEAMVRELADELAAEFEARHPASAREQQPATQRAYDRDMAIVRQARKLIEQ